jgi:phosphoglycerate dehydrogenase-like enzyme
MQDMQPLKIGLLFDDTGYVLADIQTALAPHAVDHLAGCRAWPVEQLAATCRTYDVLITGRASPALPASLIGDRGRLRLLAHCHGTIRHLVSKAHIEAGLAVSNWGDNVAGVAESALMLLLACLKQVHALDAHIRADWSDDQRIWQDIPASLIEAPVGLYGFGPIGRHMGRFCTALGAQVAIYDPYARDVPAGIRVCATLRELFATSHVVSIHCGLNDATRGSVNRELLELLPQGGVLVNTARGPIVVEDDLVSVLAAGRIVAGLDVIVDEKHWATSPFATLPSSRVLLTGHVAGGSKGSDPARTGAVRRRLPRFVIDNLHALAAGRPLANLVTADIYDLKT